MHKIEPQMHFAPRIIKLVINNNIYIVFCQEKSKYIDGFYDENNNV